MVNVWEQCFAERWWKGTHAQLCPTLCNPVNCSLPLLCPWNYPGKNTGVVLSFPAPGILPTQGSNPYLLCLVQGQADSLPTEPPGKPLVQRVSVTTGGCPGYNPEDNTLSSQSITSKLSPHLPLERPLHHFIRPAASEWHRMWKN